jgi:thiamine-monophosphate kinase
MAAMGAMPYWAMLALTLPSVDHAWLGAFAKGFFDLAEEFNVSLVGGDTTRGPLSLTVTIMGEVPAGAALQAQRREGRQRRLGLGQLGDAALAVAHRKAASCSPTRTSTSGDAPVRADAAGAARPGAARPRHRGHRHLRRAARRISAHICRLSGVGATVELDASRSRTSRPST